MIAPSPDWFIGGSGLNLRPAGAWTGTITVPLIIYDACTEEGMTLNPDGFGDIALMTPGFEQLPGPIALAYCN